MVLGGNSSNLIATGRQQYSQPTTGRGFWGDLGQHILGGIDWAVDKGLGLLSPHLSNAYQNVKNDINNGAHWSTVAGHVGEGILHGGADVLAKVAGVHPGYLPLSEVVSGISDTVKNPSLSKVRENVQNINNLHLGKNKRGVQPKLDAYAKRPRRNGYKQ